MSPKDSMPFPTAETSSAASANCVGEGSSVEYGAPLEAVPGVQDVVLVASGKGGVGKSTVTVNLACALRRDGFKVGVLDADIYGPSVASMLGTGDGLEQSGVGKIVPAERHGIYSVSVGNVVPPEAALAWKGPLVTQALMQMFHEVAWPDLDMLLVDLPPTTGDVQLSILEQVPVSGVVVVTTPQRLALIGAERAIALFHQLDIPVFGVVENMNCYICPCCGEKQPLFPAGGAVQLADRKHVSYFGGIPLHPTGQECAEGGTPLTVAHPDGQVSQASQSLAVQVAEAVQRERRLRERERDAASRRKHQAFWERLLDDEWL